MNSTHKKLFWSGLSLFIIPELLWSPLLNMLFELFISGRPGGVYPYRNTWIMNSDAKVYLTAAVFVEGLGLLILSYALWRKSVIMAILALLGAFIAFFVFLLLLSIKSVGL